MPMSKDIRLATKIEKKKYLWIFATTKLNMLILDYQAEHFGRLIMKNQTVSTYIYLMKKLNI